MVSPVSLVPQSPDGFYAINNPFLVSGPKSFIEFMPLENDDMYLRFDMPGVPNNGIDVLLDKPNRAICILGNAPKEHKYDATVRCYDGTTLRPKLAIQGINSKIVCKCHGFYSGFTSHMSDGVLRLVLKRIHSKTPPPPCISFIGGPDGEDSNGYATARHVIPASDPNDPNFTGPILMPHPCVGEGSQMPYESKVLQNGGLYVRVDMPGVPKENFTVSVANGRVKVTGEAPALSHDTGGRFYSGDVAVLSNPAVDIPIRKIKTIAKSGVIRLIIPPV